MASSSVVEVLISGFTLVLPLLEGDTVASVTDRAVEECRSFYLRQHTPKRVLYTKDGEGRILSGSLSFPLTSINSKLEIVMEDYSEKDLLPPEQVERQYRDWQCWTAMQLKDHVENLVFREATLTPSPSVLTFIEELCQVPNERVQSTVLNILRLLLSKCENKSVVVQSAELISQLFVKTSFAQIAIQVLTAFQNLNPLQLKLFDSVKYVRAMWDVYRHITRFSIQERGKLFAAFESILSLIDDPELKKALAQAPVALALRAGEDVVTNEGGDGSVEEVAMPRWVQRLQQPDDESEWSTTRTDLLSGKKWNVKRVQSLIVSEDAKIRRFGLEKLKRRLQEIEQQQLRMQSSMSRTATANPISTSSSPQLRRASGNGSSSSARGQEEIVSGLPRSPSQRSTAAVSADCEQASPIIPPLAQFSAATSQKSSSQRSSKAVSDRIDPKPVSEEELLNLCKNEEEAQQLVQSLFQCIKHCLKARGNTANNVNNGSTNAKGANIHKGNGTNTELVSAATANLTARTTTSQQPIFRRDSQQQQQQQQFQQWRETQGDKVSLAGRLFWTAWQSPETDCDAVALAVDCLHRIYHCRSDIATGECTLHSDIRNTKVNPLLAQRLSNIQKVVMFCGRDWYRLLFTLSHAEELSTAQLSHSLVQIAEQCAELFAQTVIHGLPRGWAASALQLQYYTIARSLCEHVQPTCGVYLSMTYLAFFSKSCVINVTSPKATVPSSHGTLIQMLLSNDSLLVKSLWWWLTHERSNFHVRRLTSKTLAHATAVLAIAKQLWAMDPISQLLELMCKSFHREGEANHVSFLQRDNVVVDREDYETRLEDEDSYYDESDYEDEGTLESTETKGAYALESSGEDVKVDAKLLRALLKLMGNLLRAARLKDFSSSHRQQLQNFLKQIRIGEDPQLSLERLSRRDNIIAAYLDLIEDQLALATDIDEPFKDWIE